MSSRYASRGGHILIKSCVSWVKKSVLGSLGGTAVWHLPLAQSGILETRDQGPRQAPCMEPASLSPCVSASLSLMNE